jgi:hypothetical protein
MKVLDGHKHLTQTERKAITRIIEAGLLLAKVGRKIYKLSLEGSTYSVSITEKRANDFGQIKDVTFSCKFSL